MAQSHSTASPEAAKASSVSHPPVPVIQTAPEHEASHGSTFGQRVVSAIGGGSPEAPPHRFGSMLANMSGSSSMQAGVLRHLQRSYGNSYVGNVIQAKLAVNQPGDIYEQEADRVAEQVVQMKEAPCHCGGTCSDCKADQEQLIQRKVTPQSNPSGASVPNNFLHHLGAGQPLNHSTRSFFESRLDQDFSQVRVHSDARAAETTRSLNARAFTVGKDVAFGPGQFSPETSEGRKLLAHELTHVVQQNGTNRFLSQNHSIQRQEDVAEETQQSILNLSQLTLRELKAKIIEAQEEEFWAEADRLKGELELRIQPLLLSEDVNLLSFEEVGERISEIQYWLNLFPEESAEQDILPTDHRSFLESKARRLKVEIDKPLSLKYRQSLDPSQFTLTELMKELELIRNWQSSYKDVSDPTLTHEAESYISELNQCIEIKYSEVSKMSFSAQSAQDLSDEAIIGNVMNARKTLSRFDDPNNPLYIQTRENLHYLELEAERRDLLTKPIEKSHLEIEYNDYEGPGPLPNDFRKSIAPLDPENMRYHLENLIAEGGIERAKDYLSFLEVSIPIIEELSIPSDQFAPLFNIVKSDPYSGTQTEYSISVRDTFHTIKNEAEKAYELAKTQFNLLEIENKNFLIVFKAQAKDLMRMILKNSRLDVDEQLFKYGFTHREISRGNYPRGSTLTYIYDQDMGEDKRKDLRNTAEKLLQIQLQIKELKESRKYAEAEAVQVPKPSGALAYDDQNLQIKRAEEEFALLRAESETRHPILATFEKGEGYNLDVLRSIAKVEGLGMIGHTLFNTLDDIETVSNKLESGEINIWRKDNIIQLTKANMGVVPGSMRDKVIDDKVDDEEPSKWRSIAIAVITIGLAILAAPVTAGSSLVAGAALVAGTALDLYLLTQSIKEYNLQKAETGTHYDKAKAISQNDPSLFWLAFELVATAVGLTGAVKAFGKLAKASKTIKTAGTVDEIAEAADSLRQVSREADLGDDVVRRLEKEALAENPNSELVESAATILSRSGDEAVDVVGAGVKGAGTSLSTTADLTIEELKTLAKIDPGRARFQLAKQLAKSQDMEVEEILRLLDEANITPMEVIRRLEAVEELAEGNRLRPKDADFTEHFSTTDRPRGAPPIESQIKGDIGEYRHTLEVVTKIPPKASEHPGLRMLLDQLMTDKNLKKLMANFPPEGVRQLELMTSKGKRFIDHAYRVGDNVIFRESKNVNKLKISKSLRTQIAKDLEFLSKFDDAIVEWRIEGVVDDALRDKFKKLFKETKGRFRVNPIIK